MWIDIFIARLPIGGPGGSVPSQEIPLQTMMTMLVATWRSSTCAFAIGRVVGQVRIVTRRVTVRTLNVTTAGGATSLSSSAKSAHQIPRRSSG